MHDYLTQDKFPRFLVQLPTAPQKKLCKTLLVHVLNLKQSLHTADGQVNAQLPVNKCSLHCQRELFNISCFSFPARTDLEATELLHTQMLLLHLCFHLFPAWYHEQQH